MRLTLRTLLSYLDDTLEPSQAKAIGAKVAESEQARELMERIKQVTRRRRLTTPPPSGPGGIDANTIAEYLDNDVSAEQAAEVEQICLASDVHLAEVAACHQILTLVLGEPALVPPTAKQRMYGLVKGPESIPFRKPAKVAAQDDQDLSSEIEPDQDDAVRMGVPAVRKRDGSNLVFIIGGGVLAACLLVVAVWQLTNTNNSNVIDPKKDDLIVQGGNKDKDKDKDKDSDRKDDSAKDGEKKKDPDEKDKSGDKLPPPKKDKDDPPPEKAPTINVVPVKIEPLPEVAYQVASLKQNPVGKYAQPGIKEPGILLQAKPGNTGWARISGKNAPVLSGRTLLSLSGSKNVIGLETGVEVTLWGNLPEATLDWTIFESRAVLHSNVPQLDADLTLERGRIVLRNKKQGKDALIRVRFNDPTQAKEEFFDVILNGSDSAVIFERTAEMDRDEPFYENPKDANRKGPMATIKIFAYEGSAIIRSGQVTYSISDGQQPMLQWQSRQGLLGTPAKVFLPPWFKGMPELKDAAAKARDKVASAHKKLADVAETKEIDVALAELEETVQEAAKKELAGGKGVSGDTFTLARYALRCEGALDNIAYLFGEFEHEKTPFFIRGLSLETLQQWLPLHRDNDYQLLEVVRKNYRKGESVKIVELFHLISTEDALKPATYQTLIEGLNNDLMPIRMLSHWHLRALAPAGAKIPYDPAMPSDRRKTAVQEWVRLIPAGQLPGTATPAKK